MSLDNVNDLNVLDLSMSLEDLSTSTKEFDKHVEDLDELEDVEIAVTTATNSMEDMTLESGRAENLNPIDEGMFSSLFVKKLQGGYGDTSNTNIKMISSKVIPIIATGVMSGWNMNKAHHLKAIGTIDSVYDEIETIRELSSMATTKEMVDTDTVLMRETISLSMGYVLPRTPMCIVTALSAISDATKYIHYKWLPEVKLIGEQILKASKLHDVDNPIETVKRLTDAVNELDFDELSDGLKATPTRDVRFVDRYVYSGVDLPGNYSLFVFRPDLAIEDDASYLLKAMSMRKRQVKLMRTVNGKRLSNSSTSIKTFSLKDIETVLSECNKTLKLLEDISKADIHQSLMFTANEIRSSFNERISDVNKRIHIPYHNAAHHYTSAYLKWSTTPSTALYTHSLITIRAALTVCRRCLVNYK